MRFNNILPELYVVDFQKSLYFYTEILGFKLEYQRPDPLFAFLSYQGSQLMIQQEDDEEEWHLGKPEYPFGRSLLFSQAEYLIPFRISIHFQFVTEFCKIGRKL